ncbi:single-stranded DNA-binding protein, partial [Segatella sinensis]|uniref:single-stranded DNA-binding protein n=1 Tax=Segatella sinensis TaxID=3085167 RepID=UPI003999F06E
VRNFEKSSLARFGVSIKTTEKKGGVEITSSSIQSFESWIKNEDQAILDLLKKGKRVKVEGFFKSETYQKDGKDHHVIKLIATGISEVEKQKKEEAA